jgi:hypothetical protein
MNVGASFHHRDLPYLYQKPAFATPENQPSPEAPSDATAVESPRHYSVSLSDAPSSSGIEWTPVRSRRTARLGNHPPLDPSPGPRGRGHTGAIILDDCDDATVLPSHFRDAAALDDDYYGGVDITRGAPSGSGCGSSFARPATAPTGTRVRPRGPPRPRDARRIGHFSASAWWMQGTVGRRPPGAASAGRGPSPGPGPSPGRGGSGGGGGIVGGISGRSGAGTSYWADLRKASSGPPASADASEPTGWAKDLALHLLGGPGAQAKPEFEHVLRFLHVAMVRSHIEFL